MKISRSSLLLALGISSSALLSTGCGEDEIRLCIQNTHGIPAEHSDTDPAVNLPEIASLLKKSECDIALVQENFEDSYGFLDAADYPYEYPQYSGKENEKIARNGLSRLSKFEIQNPYAYPFGDKCNGTTEDGRDCIGKKGVSVAGHEVISGVWIDIYNLHMDSGDSEMDQAAREAQIDILINAINSHSPYKAIIVAGDFNCDQDDYYIIERLQNDTGLEDSCKVLNCSEPNSIDRIFYRSGEAVIIEPLEWNSEVLVDEEGNQLSDHPLNSVDFKITAVPPSVKPHYERYKKVEE